MMWRRKSNPQPKILPERRAKKGFFSSLKGWGLIAFILVLLIVALNYIIGPQMLADKARMEIKKYGKSALGMDVTVSKLNIRALLPFQMEIRGVTGGDSQNHGDLQIRSIEIAFYPTGELLKPKTWGGQLLVSIEQPTFSVRETYLQVVEDLQGAPSQPSREGSSTPKWVFNLMTQFLSKISVSASIRGMGISYYQAQREIHLSGINISVSQAQFLNSEAPLGLKFESLLNVTDKLLPLPSIPIRLETSSLILKPDEISAQKMRFTFGHVETLVSGMSRLSDGFTRWHLLLNIPDLAKLPIPVKFLPPGQWQGGIQGSVLVERRNGQQDFKVSSHMNTKGLRGQVKMKGDGYRVEGPLMLNLAWGVVYESGKITAPKIQIQVQGTGLDAEYAPYFIKKPGVPLLLDINGYGADKSVVIKASQLQLAQIRQDYSGYVNLDENGLSQIQIKTPLIKLKGLEKVFPVLGTQPAQGDLQLRAKVSGYFQKGLEGLLIEANPVTLKKFKTSFNLRDDKNKIYAIGPVKADLKSRVEFRRGKLGPSTVKGAIDISGMELSYKDLVQKPMNLPLKVEAIVGKKGDSFSVSKGQIQLGSGFLILNGGFAQVKKPRLKLKIESNNLNFADVGRLGVLPKQMKINGTLNSKLDISGIYDFEKAIASPLNLAGTVHGSFQEITYGPRAPVSGEEATTTATAKASVGPLAPDWPIIRGAKLGMYTTINHLNYGKMKAKGVAVKANLNRGKLSATANIKSVFGGRLQLKKFTTSLVQPDPLVQASSQFTNLDFKKILEFALPQYASEVEGIASGKVAVKTYFPQSQNFSGELRASGVINANKVFLRSVNLDKAINDGLKKIPKVKLQQVKTEGFRGGLNAVASFVGEVININKFRLKTQKNDELSVSGSASLTGRVDMTGQLVLAKPPMGGEIYTCNADEQGRLVLPVGFKGSWREPGIHFARTTIDKLLKNTAQCQVKKAKAKAKQRVNQELKSTTKKLEKQLEKEVEKQLKGLFD